MAIKSGFFNSINGDRKYDANRFAEYFATFIGNGVFPNPSSNLQVMANNDMTVTVSVGKAWINGYILINDDDYILNIEPADGILSRIDRIVARYDTVDREIRLEVKQGAYSSSPVAPSLQRDADAHELGLADVYVGKGIISITQANITDLRLNSDVCGIVHGLVDQVDTTTIFNQYQAWFNDITSGTEQEIADWQQQQYDDFMIWFQSIQDILEGDVAANLASRISSLENDFTSHLAESAQQAHLAKNIGLEDTAGNFTATELEGAMSELFTNVSNGKLLIGGAITDVDESVVIPTEPSFGDLASAISRISTGLVSEPVIPGNGLIYNQTSTISSTSNTVEKKFEKEVLFGGTIRISFSLKVYKPQGGYTTGYCQVYINDEPVGIRRSRASDSWSTYTEDIQVKKNDKVQLYMYRDADYLSSSVDVKDISFGIDLGLVL